MQRAVINLFDRWGLTDTQAATLLGEIAPRTFQRWKAGEYGRVGPDLSARGYGWIKRPNAAFGDQSALAVTLGGQLTDLMRVRRYLDAVRGPW